MYVIPKDGYRIPDPAMLNTPDAFLPPQGREVQPSEYWQTLARDGDVEVIDPAQVIAGGGEPL